MPLDPSFAGHSYPPTAPYRVGREKIREFCEAIGAGDQAYLDPEAARKLGYSDVVAPPTFAIVLTNSGVRQLVEDHISGRLLGIIGEPHVNVLKLNLALDAMKS